MKYIFLVDDSVTIRTSVQFTVKKLGWQTQEAENGSDALKKIEELKRSGHEIVLYITDVNMPVMDGISFVKELRKKDRFTPILFLTTESDGGKIQEGKEAGASGWLVKPFQSEQLINVVNRLIK